MQTLAQHRPKLYWAVTIVTALSLAGSLYAALISPSWLQNYEFLNPTAVSAMTFLIYAKFAAKLTTLVALLRKSRAAFYGACIWLALYVTELLIVLDGTNYLRAIPDFMHLIFLSIWGLQFAALAGLAIGIRTLTNTKVSPA